MSSNMTNNNGGDRYELLSRYAKFTDSCNDPTKDVVRVFEPLSRVQLEELELIREVTRELQKKKEDDMEKAAQIANEAKSTIKLPEGGDPKEPEQQS